MESLVVVMTEDLLLVEVLDLSVTAGVELDCSRTSQRCCWVQKPELCRRQ
jgi:hypothetical protein